MMMSNPKLNMLMSSELDKKTNKKLIYSDESGTYLSNNYKDVTKYIDGETTYKKWIEQNITPMFAKLTGATDITFIPFDRVNKNRRSKLVNNGTRNVLNKFVSQCRKTDSHKKIYLTKNECIDKGQSVGNICDDDITINNNLKMVHKSRYNKIPPEIKYKWENDRTLLTLKDISTLSLIYHTTFSGLTDATKIFFINKLEREILREFIPPII